MLRAPLGSYFLGQLGTFVYLVEVMGGESRFDAANWAPFSIYNLVVANFWPLYWVVYFVDAGKLNQFYWHVYDVAQARGEQVASMFQYFGGS